MVWQAETPQYPTFRYRTPKARPFIYPKINVMKETKTIVLTGEAAKLNIDGIVDLFTTYYTPKEFCTNLFAVYAEVCRNLIESGNSASHLSDGMFIIETLIGACSKMRKQ